MNELPSPQFELTIDELEYRRELAAELRAALDQIQLTPTEQENQ